VRADRLTVHQGRVPPLLALVGIGEAGTHAVIAAAMDSYATNEMVLANMGGFRSELVASDDTYRREHVIAVRFIEYTIADPERPQIAGTTYRLVTTVLDPARAPAAELAALYAECWEIESILDDLETHRRRGHRGHDPDQRYRSERRSSAWRHPKLWVVGPALTE